MKSVPVAVLRLTDAWRQAERHVHHMQYAILALAPLLPFNEARFAGLTDEQIQDVDQFTLRFSKLQDVLGARLLPAILNFLGEPFEARPMLDKLNRLEKLGLLPSVERWQYLREIRNRFTHDYPDDPERNAVNLNLAIAAADELRMLMERLYERLAAEHPQLELARLS